jgi:hypothetical protein
MLEEIVLNPGNTCNYAFFWFIPLIIAAAVAYADPLDIWSKPKIGMAVLGMPQSGKTLWYDFLSGSKRGGKTQTSGGVDVDSFDLMCGKEHVATIKKGTDIAGGDLNIRKFYEKMIRENDCTFFFFNAEQYLSDIEYKRNVDARLSIISSYEGLKDDSFFLVLTYIDLLKDRKTDVNEIINQISNKSYGKLAKYYFPVNMMDEGEKENLKNKIFGA